MPTLQPRIGFSIDSIVGNSTPKSPPHAITKVDNLQRSPSPPQSYSVRLNRLQSLSPPHNYSITRLPESPQSIPETQTRLDPHHNTSPALQARLTPDDHPSAKRPRSSSPPSSPSGPMPPIGAPGPIIVPGLPAGLIRPFPVSPPQQQQPAQNPDIKSLPPFMHTPEMVQAAHNQHFLAAQFQAAALAHAQAGQPFPPHPAHMHNPNLPPRDSYPLYPWLLSRHGRGVFPIGFPGNYLIPFRKSKRVRTAFSPSQLLKLEHAFESNHYVVGAERKQLAQNLNLSETQVKVWFQNRRTKHKRMQQEEGKSGESSDQNRSTSSPASGGSCPTEHDEDEFIDMDDCPSDEENMHHNA